jgi:hypothetical protein
VFLTTATTRARRRRARNITLPALALCAGLFAAGTPLVARAQLARLPQVAVLDLQPPAGVPSGDIWARQATDALVVEMTRTGRFDVIPREQVVRQARDLGLPEPLDAVAVQKLGQALGADYVATGALTRLGKDKDGRAASAGLTVVFTDPRTGAAANGAYVLGTARSGGTVAEAKAPSAAAADDALKLHALSNAAFTAVRELNGYTLPEATVLNSAGPDYVLINGGARSGIRAGQEFLILRGGQQVGRVRITSVSATSAVATVTDPGRGIRPEDKARAVFSFADLLSR